MAGPKSCKATWPGGTGGGSGSHARSLAQMKKKQSLAGVRGRNAAVADTRPAPAQTATVDAAKRLSKRLFTLLDLCVSSLRRGHARQYRVHLLNRSDTVSLRPRQRAQATSSRALRSSALRSPVLAGRCLAPACVGAAQAWWRRPRAVQHSCWALSRQPAFERLPTAGCAPHVCKRQPGKNVSQAR